MVIWGEEWTKVNMEEVNAPYDEDECDDGLIRFGLEELIHSMKIAREKNINIIFKEEWEEEMVYNVLLYIYHKFMESAYDEHERQYHQKHFDEILNECGLKPVEKSCYH